MAIEDCVTQRTRKLVEHRRLLEEGELVAVERAEHLVAHVVREQPVVAAEARDAAMEVLTPGQGQGGEEERRRPALGALQQDEHVVGRELELRQAQQRRRLAPRHDQVTRAQVDQPPLRAQASDREIRLPATRCHHLRAGRQRVGDRHHHAVRRARAQVVEVVEHEHERLFAPLDDGGQLDERGGGHEVVECERDRSHKPLAIVVRLVNGEPGDGAPLLAEPVLDQRGLAVARGRDEQRQRHMAGLREAAQEPLATQRALAQAGTAAPAIGRSVLLGEQQRGPVSHLTVSIPQSANARQGCAPPYRKWGRTPPFC